jgi:hypothetical protein
VTIDSPAGREYLGAATQQDGKYNISETPSAQHRHRLAKHYLGNRLTCQLKTGRLLSKALYE